MSIWENFFHNQHVTHESFSEDEKNFSRIFFGERLVALANKRRTEGGLSKEEYEEAVEVFNKLGEIGYFSLPDDSYPRSSAEKLAKEGELMQAYKHLEAAAGAFNTSRNRIKEFLHQFSREKEVDENCPENFQERLYESALSHQKTKDNSQLRWILHDLIEANFHPQSQETAKKVMKGLFHGNLADYHQFVKAWHGYDFLEKGLTIEEMQSTIEELKAIGEETVYLEDFVRDRKKGKR